MNKWQALQQFWSSFDLPAYDENTVPQTAEMPYITYEGMSGSFDEPVAVTASIWYYSESWSAISQKADEISASIGLGGTLVSYDNGAIWVKRGVPFAQRMSDTDSRVRRIVLNLELEYLTEN